ncbi:hypothetical protein CPC08DRAFT_249159 [Agrocybe pediades]|nr:hypothetical protein CPC08DRAFT_249159 [Agrocybe pediades]
MLSSTVFLAVLAAVVPSTIASFPGSSFGIAYNTTSTAIPTTGHLGTFQAEGSSPVFLTALVDGPNDLGGFFSVSGPNGFLNEACGVNGLATLIPANPIIGIKYALGWSKAPLSSLPTGSFQDGFQLGPAPTFDTIINTKVRHIFGFSVFLFWLLLTSSVVS